MPRRAVSDMLIQIMPFILIMGIMWFLILRPQRQAQKRHQELPLQHPSR